MVERTNQRRIVFEVVEKGDRLTLNSLIEKYVVKGSIIYTDNWKGYNDLSNIKYQHLCVNHSIELKIANTNILPILLKVLGVGWKVLLQKNIEQEN